MAHIPNIPSPLKWIVRIIGGTLLLAVILYAAALWWLSSEMGQKEIAAQIRSAAAEAGYTAEVKGLNWQFPIHFTVDSLSLKDKDGTWLRAQKLMLNILPSLDMLENLTISELSAKRLDLLHAPDTGTESPPSSGDPLTTTIRISDIRINHLHLATALTQLEEPLNMPLEGDLTLNADNDRIEFDALSEKATLPSYKEKGELNLAGYYGMADEVVSLQTLNFSSPSTRLSGQATLDLLRSIMDADIALDINKLASWNPELQGQADFELQAKGPLTTPQLNAQGQLKNLIYQQEALPDTQLKMTGQQVSKGWRGDIAITSSGAGLTASSQLFYASPTLQLSDLSISLQQNNVNGNLLINIPAQYASGTLHADLPELAAFNPYLPYKLDGKLNVDLTLEPQSGVQSAKLYARVNGLAVQEPHLLISSATATISLSDISQPDQSMADIQAKNLQYSSYNIQTLNITAQPAPGGLQSTIIAKGTMPQPISVNVSSILDYESPQQWLLNISALTAQLDQNTLRATAPLTIEQQASNLSLQADSLSLNNSPVSLAFTRKPQSVRGHLKLNKLKPAIIWPDAPAALEPALMAIDATLSGTPRQPLLKSDITIDNIQPLDQKTPVQLSIKSTTRQDETALNLTLTGIKQTSTTLEANLPTTFTLQPFNAALNKTGALTGSASLNSDIAAITSLLSVPEHEATGKLEGRLTLSGTPESPSINGNITLKNGSYRFIPAGIYLKNLSATIQAENRHMRITQFHAEDAQKHPLNLTGEATLPFNDTLAYKIDINSKNMNLINHPNAKGALTLDIDIAGDADAGTISGKITSEEMNIYLPDKFASNVPELNVVKTLPKQKEPSPLLAQASYPLNLNLVVDAPNQLFVRGQGLTAELKGKLTITQTISDPDIRGTLSTVRGRYEQFGKNFTLDEATLTFRGDIPPSPYLNVVASTKEGGYKIMPKITGPALKPTFKVTSSPPLPEEEALSILLFGKSAAEITPLQAAQLANSLAQLSGKGGTDFNPLKTARDALGVDDISVNSEGDAADTTVGVGKYLTDDVYLELERGAQTTSGKARIEVNVLPNISVESSTGATGDNSVGVNWKYDY